MKVKGSRVGIVGGSIAGCATAIALGRLGCQVEVFERSSGELRDRGSGISIPIALRDELIEHDYLSVDYHHCLCRTRRFIVNDGTFSGRTTWTQVASFVTNNWGVLWRGLRDRVDDETYHDGQVVSGVEDGPDGVKMRFRDGQVREFDVVVGADGYRSSVRSKLYPDSTPEYAGYVLWRGNFPESELRDRDAWDELNRLASYVTVVFDGGHGGAYPIPEFAELGNGLRVNWGIYAPKPPQLHLSGVSSIPPGGASSELFAHFEQLRMEYVPGRLLPLFGSDRSGLSIQPIYDLIVDHYTDGHLVLVGDASTLTRPHTGSGATKAIQDARCLEDLGRDHKDWDSLLKAFDADRTPSGRAIVELGRRIGRDQVEHTPSWAEMQPQDYQRWIEGTLNGDDLYFFGDMTTEEA